ncbi:MAG: hypothetical protein A2Z44_01375 [Betaproteobacteria bacterium RBG_19FT_COMBO_58_11]|nr:MAG: hypothetical protein A2Z44_01375 [Betaproteobacteria bacterium RBG_19FT_COMBO_58_11]
MNKDLAASVRVRLLNLAKAQGVDFNQVLVRFALERILYRLSQSAHADRFLLKGALLFTLWYDMPHRATRDADLLGFGPSDLDSIAQTFRDIASVEVADGIVFDPDSVSAEEIRKEAGYAGARVLISGEIAKARCKTQIDMTNSRMKDYLDLSVLLERETLDADTLAGAIAATFIRRGMAVPATLPVGLTDEFATDPSRQTLWHAFLRKNELDQQPLPEVVAALRARLEPTLLRATTLANQSPN